MTWARSVPPPHRNGDLHDACCSAVFERRSAVRTLEAVPDRISAVTAMIARCCSEPHDFDGASAVLEFLYGAAVMVGKISLVPQCDNSLPSLKGNLKRLRRVLTARNAGGAYDEAFPVVHCHGSGDETVHGTLLCDSQSGNEKRWKWAPSCDANAKVLSAT